MKRILPLVALCVLARAEGLRASSLVVLANGRVAVLAADSRFSRTFPDGHSEIINDLACKIVPDGRTVLGMTGFLAGLTGDNDHKGPDLPALWRLSRRHGVAAADRAAWLAGAIAAEQVKADFDGLQTGVAVVGFRALQSGFTIIRALSSPARPRPKVVAAGRWEGPVALAVFDPLDQETTNLAPIAERLKRPTSESELIALARTVVRDAAGRAERRAKKIGGSSSVGGPIDILVLDQQGPRWIQVKPECR